MVRPSNLDDHSIGRFSADELAELEFQWRAVVNRAIELNRDPEKAWAEVSHRARTATIETPELPMGAIRRCVGQYTGELSPTIDPCPSCGGQSIAFHPSGTHVVCCACKSGGPVPTVDDWIGTWNAWVAAHSPTPEPEATELRPCPWCGGAACMIDISAWCTACGAEGPKMNYADVKLGDSIVALWNGTERPACAAESFVPSLRAGSDVRIKAAMWDALADELAKPESEEVDAATLWDRVGRRFP